MRKGPEGEAQEERESSQGSNMCRAGETGKQNLILPLDGGTSPKNQVASAVPEPAPRPAPASGKN